MGEEIIRTRIEAKDNATETYRKHAKHVKKGMNNVEKAVNSTKKALSSYVGVFASMVGAQRVYAGAKEALKYYEQQEQALRQLKFQITDVGKEGEAAFGLLIKQSQQMQAKGIFGDEMNLQAMTMLSQFGATSREIRKAIPVINDFAAATGQDLPAAMQKVLSGMAGSTRGLKVYGLEIDGTKEKSLLLRDIIQQLTDKFQGNAAMLRDTVTGQLQTAANTYGDLKEEIGEVVAASGALNAITYVLNEMTSGYQQLAEEERVAHERFMELAAGQAENMTVLEKFVALHIRLIDKMAEKNIKHEAAAGLIKSETDRIKEQNLALAANLQLVRDQIAEKEKAAQDAYVKAQGPRSMTRVEPITEGIIDPIAAAAERDTYTRNAELVDISIMKRRLHIDTIQGEISAIQGLTAAYEPYMEEMQKAHIQQTEQINAENELSGQRNQAVLAGFQAQIEAGFGAMKANMMRAGAEGKALAKISKWEAMYSVAMAAMSFASQNYAAGASYLIAAGLHWQTASAAGGGGGSAGTGMSSNPKHDDARNTSYNPYQSGTSGGDQNITVTIDWDPGKWDEHMRNQASQEVSTQISRGGAVRNALERNMREL